MNVLKRKAVPILGISTLVLLSIYVAAQLAPIHVLRDWTIRTTEKEYSRGSTLTIESSSTKLRKAGGEATRTIECNYGQDSVRTYQLESTEAKRPPGTRTRNTDFIVPTNVVGVPVTCRMVISVEYKVYWNIRTITENSVSNDFKVNP